jgi:hypothetical protein
MSRTPSKLNDYRKWFKGWFTNSELKQIIAANIQLCGGIPAKGLISIRRSDAQLKAEDMTKAELLALVANV